MIGILLAAGFSRRYGDLDKLLQPLPDGQPIAIASAENLMQAVPTCIAVLRPENKVLADSLSNRGVNLVFCSKNDQEMADSLATAIRFSAKFSDFDNGFVIALGDMPYIQPATISEVTRHLKAGAAIVVPTFQGQRGHPVGFSAKFRNQLESLKGDEGARSIIKRYSHEVTLFACDDAGILADIDTPDDLNPSNPIA